MTFQNLFFDRTISPRSEKSRGEDYRWIFVGGFLNEGVTLYFKDNIKALRNIGVPEDQIRETFSPSSSTVLQAADLLFKELESVVLQSKQKLILIGHSKGASELLALAVQHPSFVTDHIEAVVLIQGALGGSPLASLFSDGDGINSNNLSHWTKMKILGAQTVTGWMDSMIGVGLKSLTPASCQVLLDLAKLLHGHDVEKKIYYIISSEPPAEMIGSLRFTGEFLDQFGPNDGMVLKKDQWIENFGTVLLDFNADHTDFVTSGIYTTRESSLRDRLMRALALSIKH